jgi:sugar phosphate permease
MKINRTEAMAYMTAFYLGYIVTQIPGGLLADRFGPRLVLFWALVLQGLGTLGLGLTENYQVGFMMRIICGLGAGCVFSSCLKAVVNWFTPAQRGLALGVVYLSPPLGIAIPNLVMPLLSGPFGWSGAFRALGLVIIGLSFVLLGAMKEVRTAPSGPGQGFLGGLGFVLRNRNILLISLSGFSGVWSQIGFGSVANPYLVTALGFTVAEAGRIMLTYGLVGLLMPPLAGYLCVKFPPRKKALIMGSHLALAAAFLAFGEVRGAAPVLLTASLIGLLVAFLNPIYTVIIADNADPKWAATAGGVSNSIFQIGAILSPLIIGLAADARGDYGLTWTILAAGALVGIVTTALVADRPQRTFDSEVAK